ncbi:hypothetical protein [Paractinoplanes brasiliensis]|uniref:Uncharacterized protein n=1 Tax=Paractinoplanes brasiliensis TaxID=52695 RepID=A0A4R6JR21_9ACTN|nr:hypothetical protein [Actinoplanes brasiliensis]TDO39004.1 hypothetical protein C8E87_2676 [Actinoplanes brasiliensis]GID33339.1 hypothetical protein Abr02nite_83220 [Actinoplanes brasiliensis]
MEQYLDTASAVTDALFGPESGIPWWAWLVVIVAVFWKVAVREPKNAREAAGERDSVMLGAMFGDDKKGKKKKK